MKMPKEVQEAKEAYDTEYSKIRRKLAVNRAKYQGTIYEDCPPMIKEQGKFLVKSVQVNEKFTDLKSKYGAVPKKWAYYIAWHERNKVDKDL